MEKHINLKLHSKGGAIADIQRKLKKLNFDIEESEGSFGPRTEESVKQFQQDRGLLVDGVVGDETWQELVEASYTLGSRTIYVTSPLQRGDDIKAIQLWLRTVGFNPGPIDGIYGHEAESALKEFQVNNGLKEDGIVGTESIRAFHNLRTSLERNATVEFPEHRADPSSSLAAFERKIIMLDFGHGGNDKGAIGPTGLEEAVVCEDIGLRAGNLFKILGAKVIYTKKPNENIKAQERIDRINQSKAKLVISIHMNHSESPKAEGGCCYYFAAKKIFSIEGKKIANYLHEEQIDLLNLKDCRVHGKSFNVLRLTKIPAVIIEPAFITNPREEALLKKPGFRQKIATAIFDGLKTYLDDAT